MHLGKSYTACSLGIPPGLDGSKGTQVVAARCSKLTHFLFASSNSASLMQVAIEEAPVRIRQEIQIVHLMKNKGLLLLIAMYYGRPLGLFWALKYVFFIWGVSHPAVGIIYWILTLFTLFMAYVFTDVYRRRIGGRISFFHAWTFGVLLYFFAAIIVSLAHYVFYRYLASPNYIADLMEAATTILKQVNPQMEETLRQMPLPTPIRLTLQDILGNALYGAIFSVPVAARLCRKTDRGFVFPKNQKNKEDK